MSEVRVAVTGSSGFLGRSLVAALRERGDMAIPALRRPMDGEVLRWSVDHGFDPPDALSGFDAVVHLAGENLGARRWSDEQKARIEQSRIAGTRAVVEAICRADPRPRVLVSGSAVGVYGDRGARPVSEADASGSGFLAGLCRRWEDEALRAQGQTRVVLLRTGLVLGRRGGVLQRLAAPIRLGAGGPLGTGRQYVSWIHIDDAVGAMKLALDTDELEGPVNVTAPEPCENAELVRAVGRVLHRPTIMPVPAFVLRLLLGEMAGPLLLEGQRAVPTRLHELGYQFRFVDLEAALEDALG